MPTHVPLKLSLLLTLTIPAFAQTTAAAPAAPLPAFDAATIKPINPNKGEPVGFYCLPGGRVRLGYANARMIVSYAYGVADYQISGGPDWTVADLYNIEAIPPDSSPSRQQKQSTFKIAPTAEQRQMLQSLLRDRFALKVHTETREGEVYILSRGSKPLQLQPPKDPEMDSRGGIVVKQGGIIDGEAFGANATMAFLASQLSRSLKLPVLDQTGLTGGYDFHLPPADPENRDMTAAIFDVMHRLGLDLKKGKGPVNTLVIDHIERPSAN